MSKIYFKVIAALLLLTTSLSFISYADEQASNDEDNVAEKIDTDDNQKTESAEKVTEEVKVAPNLDLKEVAPPPEPVITKPKKEETKTETETEVKLRLKLKIKNLLMKKQYMTIENFLAQLQ